MAQFRNSLGGLGGLRGLPSLDSRKQGGGVPPEATALIAAMTTQPSEERKAVIATFYSTAKSRSYWSKLAYLYVLRAHSAQASKLNWLDPSKFTLTESGSLTFMADRGWAGDGSTGKLLTGLDPASADSKMTANSGSILAWAVTDFQSDSALTGYRMVSTGGGTLLIPRSTTNLFIGRCNSAASVTATVVTAAGLSASSRTGPTTTKTYRNGVPLGTGAGAVTALPAGQNLAICGTTGTQAGSSTHDIAFAAGGAGMTDQEMADIYTDVAALMQGIIDTAIYANFGDSHAGLGVLNYLGTAVGKTLTQLSFGVGGETIAQTEARVSAVIASPASIVVLQTGTNSIPTSATLTDIQTSFTSIVNALRAAGKVVWIFTIPPRGNTQQSPPITNNQIIKLLAVNDWLRTTYANLKGVKLVDTWTTVAEPIAAPPANDNPWYRPGFGVNAFPVTTKGSGYGPNTFATVTHNGGEGAAVQVNLVGGQIDSLSMVTRGFGYSPTSKPTVSIVDPDGLGSGAVIGAPTLTSGIVDYTINNGGSGVPDGATISAPQGGALEHFAHAVAPAGVVTGTVIDKIGFGYSSQATATVSGGSGASVTPIHGVATMWKPRMTTGDTHEIAFGLQAEAALLVPILATV